MGGVQASTRSPESSVLSKGIFHAKITSVGCYTYNRQVWIYYTIIDEKLDHFRMSASHVIVMI